MIDPVPQLAGAEFFGAERGHLGGDFAAPEPDQIAAGQGRSGSVRSDMAQIWAAMPPRESLLLRLLRFLLFFFAMFFHTFLGDILCADAFLDCVAAFAGAAALAGAAAGSGAGAGWAVAVSGRLIPHASSISASALAKPASE